MKISPTISIANFDVPSLVHEAIPVTTPMPAALPPPTAGLSRKALVGPRSYELSELSSADIRALCEAFVIGVFTKANKLCPPLFYTPSGDGAQNEKPMRPSEAVNANDLRAKARNPKRALTSEERHKAACSGCNDCSGADKQGVYSD